MVARGEVWWHESPNSKRRPYLVLTRDEGISVLSQVLAVPATRVIRSIPTEVPLGPDQGMPAECVLSLDNLGLVRLSHLVDRITTLSESEMNQVCTSLSFAVKCA